MVGWVKSHLIQGLVANLDEANSAVEVGLDPAGLSQVLEHVLVSVVEQHIGH